MSNALRIKRRALGGAAGAPSALAVGELAFNEVDGSLWIGRSNSSVVQVNGGGTGGTTTPADAFVATLSADQTGIAATTWSKVNFNTAGYNQNGKFNTSTSRWTPAAGAVQIEAQLTCGSSTVAISVAIYKNGGLVKFTTNLINTYTLASISVVDNANGTDYYECYVYLGSSATSVLAEGGQATFFQGFAIAPQGPAGAAGATGPQGPQGTPGPTTPADAFIATLSANQTGIAASTSTKINFNTTGYNQNSKFSTSTSRWIPSAGPVQIEAQLLFSAGTSVQVQIYKNGTLFKVKSSNLGHPCISIVDNANGTDYYECWAQGDTACSINIGNATFFQGFAIAPQGPVGLTGPQGPQGAPGPTTPADAFVATLSADQTGIAANTWSKVNFNTAGYNQNGKFNTSNGRWTPAAGPIQIEAQCCTTATMASLFAIGIYKNGTLFKQFNNNGGAWEYVSITIVDTATGSDYYECWVYNSIAITVTSGPAVTFFQGFQIAPQGPAGLTGPQGPQGLPGPTTPADAFVAALGADMTGLASNQLVKMNLSSSIYNQNNKWDTVNQRWTPSAGMVQLELQIYCSSATPSTIIAAIYKNGVNFKQTNFNNSSFVEMSVVDRANGTDYYEAYVVIIGTAPFTVASISTYTFFQGFAIAPQGPAGLTGPQGPPGTQGTPGPTTPADAFVATLSADQTGIAANTWTKINFNVAGYNQNGKFFTTGVNAGRWIPSAGPVQIEAQVSFSTQVTGEYYASIYKNGTNFKLMNCTSGNFVNISVVDTASGTDYYEVWCYNSSANTVTSPVANTFFQGFAIAPQGPAGNTGPVGPTTTTVPNVRVFTASGLYTPSANLVSAIIECIGGGGGGSGSASTAGISVGGAGGGSGGYSRRTLTPAQIGSSQPITIGAAGVGSSGNVAATNGGVTSFGSLCIANGGTGGFTNQQAGPGGAIGGAVGDVVAAGAPGGMGNWTGASGGPGGGAGGSSVLGGGGAAANSAGSGAWVIGVSASNYGGGGGGVNSNNYGANSTGGNGSAGVTIVTEYLSATAPGPSTAGVLPKQLTGLTLANDATNPNTVLDIDVGTACSDDNQMMMVLTTPFTKNCNAAFVAGSGNGALDSGSALAVNTWYHVYLIMRVDNGVVDVLISTNATAPALPMNYGKKRRIGAIRTDGSAHILGFTQLGDQFLWTVITAWNEYSNVGLNTTNNPVPLQFVPSGIKTQAILNTAVTTSGAWCAYFSPDQPGGGSSPNFGVVNAGGFYATLTIRTDTTPKIFVYADVAMGTGFYLSTMGYIDNRGK